MEPLGTTSVLLLVCISCLLLSAFWKSQANKRRKMPPGPTPLPIIGNALQLKTNHLDLTLCKLSEKYGSVFTLHFGTKPVVVLHGYSAVKEALIDQAEDFAPRGRMPLVEKYFRGQGIIFSNGERWKQLRRFALTTLRNFGMGKKSIEERIREEAQYLLERLQGTKEQPFDPTFLLNCATSNIICSIVFGKHYDYDDKKFLAIMALMNDNFEILSSPWGQLANTFPSFMDWIPGPHHRVGTNLEKSKAFVMEEMEAHRQTLDPSSPRDFIDCFFIKMDQDTSVFPLLTSVLHDGKEFPNPTEFDPQHFLNKDGTFRKSDFFMPFSAGKRICAGEGLARMELFMFLTSILQNFKLKPLMDPQDIDIKPHLSGIGNIPQPYRLCVVPR
uniref:unspecific monooxygenase n=1 Tax=Anolis carolinensis TaxID=28377 RepID=A0A803TEK4_ANOCA